MLSRFSAREITCTLLVSSALMLASGGLIRLSNYKYVPGPDGGSPEQWPVESGLSRDTRGFTALLFLHPLCPCSNVCVAELERSLVESGHHLTVQVVFVSPSPLDQWQGNLLVRRVQESDLLKMVVDANGRECQHFGATTSGHFMLFDAAGQKVIDGGLTNGRGQEGPSAGLRALCQILDGLPPEHARFPVYGCALHNPSPVQTAL